MAKKHSLLKEFLVFTKEHKNYWIAPIVIALLLVGILIIVGASKAAPFIYTLF